MSGPCGHFAQRTLGVAFVDRVNLSLESFGEVQRSKALAAVCRGKRIASWRSKDLMSKKNLDHSKPDFLPFAFAQPAESPSLKHSPLNESRCGNTGKGRTARPDQQVCLVAQQIKGFVLCSRGSPTHLPLPRTNLCFTSLPFT